MVWQLLAKPLLGVVADGVKGFVETKKAKAELAVTEIKAKQKLKEDQIAGKVAWEQSAVDQMKGSWKDELSLIVLLLPAVCRRIIIICYTLRFLPVLASRQVLVLFLCSKRNEKK